MSLMFTVFVSLACPCSCANPAAPLKTSVEISVLGLRRSDGHSQIESGHFENPDQARGSSGEVSRFQIMPEVWRSYTKSRNYTNPGVAWNVAFRILKERQAWFIRRTGRHPSAFDLYVMWNKPGLYERVDFNRGRLPKQLREVANRFENLVLAMR